MKRGTFTFWTLLVALIFFFGVPFGMFYFFDNQRVDQLNEQESKIAKSENNKSISIIEKQISENLDKVNSVVDSISPAEISKKYSSITENRIIRNNSYSQKKALNAITKEFLARTSGLDAEVALISVNGKVYDANKADLKGQDFTSNQKRIQTASSKKAMYDINFAAGTAEYFIPITDSKDRFVSIFYVKENIASKMDIIRDSTLTKHSYNFVIDTTGRVVLHTDKQKENTENVTNITDLKDIINDASNEENFKDTNYNNLHGKIGYERNRLIGDYISCVFVPYSDYSFYKKEVSKYQPILYDYTWSGLLAAALIIGFMWIIGLSASPYRPLGRIVKALTHIDEEGFTELLPKAKKGYYKKLGDSLLILRGRVKAAEEKTEKLNQMSKELEEQLSKEASRSDKEVSELRDTIKVMENTKSTQEEEIVKLRQEIEKVKKMEKSLFDAKESTYREKISSMEKELTAAKAEIKKSQELKIPAEKENMRMDSILMMNTELKGVLSVIKTYISSVLGGEGKITDAQQQFLGVVINKSARLERLINDLTELARLEKGEIKLLSQPMDLNNIIQDIIFAIQPQADIKKVEIKTAFSPSLPSVNGDQTRVSSTVTQLITQAIKVSPRGGQVAIQTKEEKGNVSIRITDFGMSLPQAKANSLFINFHGAESSAGPEFVNSGLRFPIIKALLNNMNADIWIESEIGKGKTFVIVFMKTGSGQAKPVPPAQPASQAYKTAGVIADSFKPAAFEVKPEPPKPPAQPVSSGPKIQRNSMSDIMSGPPKQESFKKEEKPLTTLGDLLSFNDSDIGKKVELPGKNTKVPQDLLKDTKATDKKPSAPATLNDLPPLPNIELEDDKGNIIT